MKLYFHLSECWNDDHDDFGKFDGFFDVARGQGDLACAANDSLWTRLYSMQNVCFTGYTNRLTPCTIMYSGHR